MKRASLLILIALCVITFSAEFSAQAQPKVDRQVAITIDDLPAGAAGFMTADEITSMTTKLLTTLRDQKVPAVGFVNEKKLYRTGHLPPGWERKMEPLPLVVERQLVPLPGGYRRGVIDGYAVVYSPRTRVIIDVTALFGPR